MPYYLTVIFRLTSEFEPLPNDVNTSTDKVTKELSTGLDKGQKLHWLTFRYGQIWSSMKKKRTEYSWLRIMEDTPLSLKLTERATAHKSKNNAKQLRWARETIRTVKQLEEQPESVLSICVSVVQCKCDCVRGWQFGDGLKAGLTSSQPVQRGFSISA